MPTGPVHVAFLGCGFITDVHSRNLKRLRDEVVCSYASRSGERAEQYRRRYLGVGSYDGYSAAINDPSVHAVVIAVPPRFHLELTEQALAAGKHVLVEKPAYTSTADYLRVQAARARADRVLLVGENDHYKPLAVCLRRLLRDGLIGDLLLAHFTTLMKRFKSADDWRNDESMAGGDAFFEEGIHWLHIANSLGPVITQAHGFRPPPAREGPDRRAKSMFVAFRYDNAAAGSLYYSREVPSLFRGLRFSKLFGRDGIITFESNGAAVLVRGLGGPRVILPGFRDIRGYQAMYRDFVGAIREGRAPEMSIETALADQRLMDQIYATADAPPGDSQVQ
ncbi:MAG: Gfo/Idh/MocA family oxidoreductase [Acidobacteria bacterium]|nr:Gfo/Idh/MocA family oxidoreductase [Acidobacteriota bacterium]